MRFKFQTPNITLFPFLSVLLCTMGILAFLSISFLIVIPHDTYFKSKSKQIEFQWIGAPAYVKPVFFRCYKNRIEYYNFFENRDYKLFLDGFLNQIDGKDPKIIIYLFQLLELNTNLKKQFRKTEYFPLLLVYPDGVFTSELLMTMIEKIKGLNFGMEPMLPDMEIPYQELNSK